MNLDFLVILFCTVEDMLTIVSVVPILHSKYLTLPIKCALSKSARLKLGSLSQTNM